MHGCPGARAFGDGAQSAGFEWGSTQSGLLASDRQIPRGGTTRAPEALELSWAADQAGEMRLRYQRGPLTLSPRRGRDECCGVELTRGYQNRQQTRESIQPKRKETT